MSTIKPKSRCDSQNNLLIIGANSRSLIANRGDLIRQLKSSGVRVSAIVPAADYLPETEDLGIPIRQWHLQRTGTNPVLDLSAILELRRLIRSFKPNTVLTYGVKPLLYGSITARLAGVKKRYAMVTGLGHTFTTNSLKNRLLRKIVVRLYRHSIALNDRVFFQNPDDPEDLFRLGILRDRSKVVQINGSGVNLDTFPQQPIPKDGFLFLLIGRLLTEKGVAEFVDAAGKIKSAWPEARFVVVGPHDPGLPHSIRLPDLEAWKAAGIVEFAGAAKDVRPWLRSCSVFVLPSYREGTPRSVLEAMATGRAIITTDAPGCRETVINGENGYLVPARTIDPLAQAMQRFLERPCLITKMGGKSRSLVEAKYDVNSVNRVISKTMGFSLQPRTSAE